MCLQAMSGGAEQLCCSAASVACRGAAPHPRPAYGRDAVFEGVETLTELVSVTLRLPRQMHQQLADAAHAARLPLAVFLRQLLGGSLPPPAPPALDAAGQQLLSILQRTASNLTQLKRHALAAGDPLARLARDGSVLAQVRIARDHLTERLEVGQLDIEAVGVWLDRLEHPSNLANRLAARLNGGEDVTPAQWHHVLLALYRVLVQGGERG